jgi:TonB-linked SusC/RagA family outer membrane protein
MQLKTTAARVIPDLIRNLSRNFDKRKLLLIMTSSVARSHRTINKNIILAMKLTTFLLTIACLSAGARGTAQTIKLDVKDAPLEKVFVQIKKQSGYSFVYYKDDLAKGEKITLHLTSTNIDEVLQQVLKDQPLTYKIVDKTIVIARSADKGSHSGLDPKPFSQPPPIDITGKVTDENGNPLVGASVKVKGSSKGTATNSEGVFTLNGVSDDAVLEISYVGFESLSIPVSGKSSIVTSLKAKPENLGEVVINKGYYTEKQRNTVGNVAMVTAADIEKQPVQNPLLALEGRVPGLEITQTTGINGGGVKVRIQGINSFGSLNGLVGTQPLIVVDGVLYPSQFPNGYMEYIVGGGSPLNYINTSDIESISVLKDADATAIYGSRAANGAILITTKKGKAGKPKLSVDLQQGWGKVTRHVDMLDTRQYLDMRYEAYKNDAIDLATDPIGYNNYDLKLWDTTRYTDWQKELIGGTARYTNINAGVSGGTELVQYLIGANYNRQTTVFPGNFANNAAGLHFSMKGNSPNQRLRIQLSSSYLFNQNTLPDVDNTRNAVLLEPNAPNLLNADGSLNWELNASGSSTWTNPLVNTLYTEFDNKTKNLVSSMNIGYTLVPGLTLSSNFGYNDLHSDLFEGKRIEYFAPEYRSTSQRVATFGSRNINSWIIEPQLQTEKNIWRGKLDFLLGTTIQKSSSKYLIVQASGQPTNELLHSLAAATTVKGINIGTAGDYTTRFNGLFGRVNYNWNQKYLINLTGRRDGSSKFGPENRFHNFWSAGAGWIFTEEKFLQSSKSWLSFGKLRASFGTTGNDQIADYSYLSLYNIGTTNIPYQGTTSFNVAGLSNPLLQWEETRKFQGGIDLSLFNERIAVDVTYARNRSSNQLISYSLPDITGFRNFTRNFPATIQNTSWEFSLSTTNLKSKNYNWSTNFNLTIPRNKVVSFPGIGLTSYASGNNGVIIGDPIGVRKLFQYGGVDPSTGSYLLLNENGKPDDPNVSTSNFNQSAKISLLPKYYGGVNNTIRYKSFQLDFLFQFVYQMGSKDLYYSNSNVPPGEFAAGSSNQPISVLKRWRTPGDNSNIGRFTTDDSFTIWPYYYTNEGYSYAAGSYIRLKNLSLSWELPKSWLRRSHFHTSMIYFRGQNLATITGYKGLDPETMSMSTLPPLQMWTIGVKIEL